MSDELLIATSRDFRDDGNGRAGDDWTWTPLRPADYERMMTAGFNLFRVRPRDLAPLIRAPVFLVASDGLDTQPGLPLLPTYRGAVMYADEPAIHARKSDSFRALRSSEEAAAEIGVWTRRAVEGSGRYGRDFLGAQLSAQGVNWGGVPRTRYPVWEAVGSAAWYELEAGAEGWCFEARPNPERFARAVRRVTGVPFPAEATAWTQLHLALFRGAARRFDAPWGVAVYGQADSAATDVLLPAAYDAGATYFWFWTSDKDHHVPHARQLQLASNLSAHARANPRPGGARERSRAAEIALVLPWGMTLDDETILRGGLWGAPHLDFDQRNEAGVPHRRVLTAALREAVALIERGDPWDILFLRDGETASGYRVVRRVLPTGDVREVSP